MISLKVVRRRSGVIMNKLFVGGIAIAALIGVPAIAADMPAPAPVVVDNWTGFYAGASLGGRFTDSNWTTTCLSVGAPGGVGCPVNLIAQNGSRFPLSNPSCVRLGGAAAEHLSRLQLADRELGCGRRGRRRLGQGP
jgi:hypothetical protein